MSFLFGVISGAYDNSVVTPPTPPPPPPPPTCTPTCGAWSYTYGSWSGWSVCSGGSQTRTRTVSGTRTCTASDCSTYTETSSTTETETQSCSTGPTWYCTTSYGSRYTSDSDQSTVVPCSYTVTCSTGGYPSTPLVVC